MAEPLDLMRTLIIGNSGSGKSWLSERLAAANATTTIDMDTLRWEPGGYGTPRSAEAAIALLRSAAAEPRWIIEGVYGWLAREAAPRATALLWLDLPVETCLSNIRHRGLRRGETEADLAALLAWAADYPHRQTPSSFAGHETLFGGFAGPKTRFTSRDEIDAFLAASAP